MELLKSIAVFLYDVQNSFRLESEALLTGKAVRALRARVTTSRRRESTAAATEDFEYKFHRRNQLYDLL